MKLFKKDNLYIPTTQETEEITSKKKWIPIIGTFVFIMIVLVSLFFVDGTLLPASDDTEYKTSKTVILPMVSISSLNPLISKDEDTYLISRQVYESLFATDERLTPVPQLVEKYEYNRTNQTLALTLKQGVKWHDGKAFTADDVEYTINAFKAAGDRCLYQQEVSKIAVAEATGTYKVVIRFQSERDMSLDILTFPILPQHQFEGIGQALDKVTGFKPIGTGPYRYKVFDPTSHLTLVANEEYHGEIPENKLMYQILPGKVNFFNLLKASNLSLIISKAADRASQLSGEDVTMVDFTSNEVEYLGYNFLQKDLAKRSVRFAIAKAIDPQKIIDESFYGSGIVNSNLYFPGYLDTDTNADFHLFDPDASDEYLDKAGYQDKNRDGYLENGDGEALTLRILVNSNNPSRVLAAKQITVFLKDVGIKVITDKVDFDTYLSKLNSGDFDLYLGGMILSKNMDLRNLLSKDGENNYLGYGNGKMDDLLNRLRSGLSLAEMKITYTEISELLNDDMPYYCLMYKTYGAIKSPALMGDVSPTFDHYYRDSDTWYCRYEVTTQTTQEQAN
jgi:peptide/nickel transport system substrate-binding protein